MIVQAMMGKATLYRVDMDSGDMIAFKPTGASFLKHLGSFGAYKYTSPWTL